MPLQPYCSSTCSSATLCHKCADALDVSYTGAKMKAIHLSDVSVFPSVRVLDTQSDVFSVFQKGVRMLFAFF